MKAKTSSALSFNLDDEEVDEDSEPGNLSLDIKSHPLILNVEI